MASEFEVRLAARRRAAEMAAKFDRLVALASRTPTAEERFDAHLRTVAHGFEQFRRDVQNKNGLQMRRVVDVGSEVVRPVDIVECRECVYLLDGCWCKVSREVVLEGDERHCCPWGERKA